MSEEDLYREIFEEEPTNVLPPLILKLCKTFEKTKFKTASNLKEYSVFPNNKNSKIIFIIDNGNSEFKISALVNNNTLETEKVCYYEVIDVDAKEVNKSVSLIKKKINDMKDYYGNI